MRKREKDILNLALMAGDIMLRNGGETYRCEETMIRICNACGIHTVETFVTPTGIFLSIDRKELSKIDQDENFDESANATFTFQRRIRNRNIDLAKVSKINDFSRSFSLEKYTLQQAMERLKEIDGPPQYSLFIRSFFAGFAAASFTGMNGGHANDILCSLVIGVLMYSLISVHDKLQENNFIKTLVAAGFGSALAVLCGYFHLATSTSTVIIGAIMILLPGVSITNAIRDSISGDLLSGMVRAFEAFITSASIAVGVALVIGFYAYLTGGVLYA